MAAEELFSTLRALPMLTDDQLAHLVQDFSQDLRLQLAVLIAAGEPGPDDALVFPWVYRRAIHAHLSITTSNSRSSPTSTPVG